MTGITTKRLTIADAHELAPLLAAYVQDRKRHALIAALTAEGEKRGWTQIRWMVPEKPATARRLAEQLAEMGGFLGYAVVIPQK